MLEKNGLRNKIFIGILLLCSYSLLVLISTIFLIHHDILWQDEWRHFDDYLFKKDFFHSVVDRQNGHLMFLPNFTFLANYYLFGGKAFWLVVFNLFLYLSGGYLAAKVLYSRLRETLNTTLSLSSTAVYLVCFFWLANYVHLYWGIGVHNGITTLGLIVAAFVLSRNNIGQPKRMFFYILAAIVASTSCGPGNAIWIIGFVAALISRQGIRTISSYFLIGLVGGMATIGYHTLTQGGTFGSPSFLTITKSSFAFIGAPVATLLQPFLSNPQQAVQIALVVGIVGVLYLLFEGFKFYRSSSKGLEMQSHFSPLFFQLIAVFTLFSAILVSYGRIVGDVSAILQPRYFGWSVLFWSSIFALVVLRIATHKWRAWSLGFLLGATFLGINLSNAAFILNSLRGYNHITKAKLDLMVHPDKVGLEKNLWQGNLDQKHFREVVENVSEVLKDKHKNIYAQAWTHWMNRSFSSLFIQKRPYDLRSTILFSKDAKTGDIYFEGSLEPPKNGTTPSYLVAVQNDTIIGIGILASSVETPVAKRYTGLRGLLRYWFNPYALSPNNSDFYLGQSVNEENVILYGIYKDLSYAEVARKKHS